MKKKWLVVVVVVVGVAGEHGEHDPLGRSLLCRDPEESCPGLHQEQQAEGEGEPGRDGETGEVSVDEDHGHSVQLSARVRPG